MARRIEYIGEPVLTLAQVAQQCRIELEDLDADLVGEIIIPGVTTQCESKTGASIRAALFEEDWPGHFPSGHHLDWGQASEVVSVSVMLQGGAWSNVPGPFDLRQGQRESFLFFPVGRPSGELRIRYKAGLDLALWPGVRNWMLMAAATALKHPEMFIVGQALAELPSSFLDHLLADITVPPRF